MFINWIQKELHIKLVYCGPPLSGKTTNLEQLHQRIPEQQRSELISIKTRQDRTLFFDFMQLTLREINGLQPKFKLYTVPGQSYYAATRKLVLKDADGLIFVADASVKRLAANRQAYNDMCQHLQEFGRSLTDIPCVFQCNKQDLPDAVGADLLARFLNIPSDMPIFSATAIDGIGTSETIRSLIGHVIKNLPVGVHA